MLKGRGVDLTDRLRGYATEKLTRTQRLFDRIIKMEVEFVHEAHPAAGHRVEVTVKTPQVTHRAHGEAGDWFSAIDQATDRLETQLRKHKERLVDRSHPRAANNHIEIDDGVDEDGRPRIFRTVVERKPMTAEEAVLELDASGMQFLFFTNSETMTTGVLYRRGDGTYGLVESEA